MILLRMMSVFAAVALSVGALAQIPRLTLYDAQANLLNPNVVRCSDGTGYLISASAVVNPSNSKAWVTKIDPSGTPVWTQSYLLGGGPDMRCYGLVEHRSNGTFMLTGYFTDGGFRYPYVLEIDGSGGMVNFRQLDVCNNFYPSGTCHGYGLDIMVDMNDNVVVTGFADEGPLSLTSNRVNGYLVQLDAGLNQNWTVQFNSVDNCPSAGNNTYHTYPMGNRVIEVPGDGYFITGSVDDEQFLWTTPYQVQAVLGAMLDYNGNLNWKNPFSIFQNCGGGNDDFHVGVDAVHDNGRVYLLSNFTNTHNFHLADYSTSTGLIGTSEYYSPTTHHWAHTVLEDQFNPDNLIVAGVQHNGSGTNYPFVANIDKGSGNVNWMYDYQVNSNPAYLQNFGQTDPRLVPFYGGYEPFIEYPDMITNTDDGYFFVANRVDGLGSPIAIDLFEIDGSGKLIGPSPGCDQTSVTLNHFSVTPRYKNVDINPPFNNPESTPGDQAFAPQASIAKCQEPLPDFEGRKRGTLSTEEWVASEDVQLFPNPVRQGETLQVEFTDELLSARVLDLSGKELIQLQDIDSYTNGTIDFPAELNPGVYFFEVQTKQAVKRHKFVVKD
ncbi:T9SS type A sorting domain-containing protein [bacterium SCSIO 12741]|nr:T9SS type A sorting domain-containing protein [bacterium SCSIO 12741]